MRIVDYLFGEMTLFIPDRTNSNRIFDILRRSGANYRHMAIADGGTVVICPGSDARALCRILKAQRIEYTIQNERGIHLFFQKTIRRPGLYLGFVCFLFLLLFSTRFVFDIRVSGNEILTDKRCWRN